VAQFDVHRNPGRNRGEIPYIVVVQSARFARHPGRLALPLVTAADTPDSDLRDLSPQFRVEGVLVRLDPLQAQTVPAARLGPVVASLADDDSAIRIINAIDLVISRAWG